MGGGGVLKILLAFLLIARGCEKVSLHHACYPPPLCALTDKHPSVARRLSVGLMKVKQQDSDLIGDCTLSGRRYARRKKLQVHEEEEGICPTTICQKEDGIYPTKVC